MVALAGDQQLGQAARLGLKPAQPVLCGAGGGPCLLFGAGQFAACRLGRLDGVARRGKVGLRRFQRLTGGFQLGRFQRP